MVPSRKVRTCSAACRGSASPLYASNSARCISTLISFHAGDGGRGRASSRISPSSAITGSSASSSYTEAMVGGTEPSVARVRWTSSSVDSHTTNSLASSVWSEKALTALLNPPSAEIVPSPVKVGSGAMSKFSETSPPSSSRRE